MDVAAAQAARPEEHHDYDDVGNYFDDYDVRDSDDLRTWQQPRQPDPKNKLLAPPSYLSTQRLPGGHVETNRLASPRFNIS